MAKLPCDKCLKKFDETELTVCRGCKHNFCSPCYAEHDLNTAICGLCVKEFDKTDLEPCDSCDFSFCAPCHTIHIINAANFPKCAKCDKERRDDFLRDCEECGRALCWTCYGDPRGEAWCQDCIDGGATMTVYDDGSEPGDEPCPQCGKKAIADEAGLIRLKDPKSRIQLFRWRCGTVDCGWLSKQWGVRDLDDDDKFKQKWKNKNPNGA